jgi:FdhE protein
VATRASNVAEAFERRADRAAALAPSSPSAQAPLEFAAGLYREQSLLADAVARAHAGRTLTGQLERDLPAFTKWLGGVLRFAAERAPAQLRELAQERLASEPSAWLVPWWKESGSARTDYLSRAVLRPYAEVLAAVGIRPDRRAIAGACPFCSGRPWVGHRRVVGDSDGAQRFLDCALCGGEWPVGRILCPACDEVDPHKLPGFRSDVHAAVHIEACATCKAYVKSIDLGVDARAIPEVDDLVSVSMDLWAADEGYTRIEPGLAGV